MFLLTSQMIGYGTCGLFRDILVRPPKIYYPGSSTSRLAPPHILASHAD